MGRRSKFSLQQKLSIINETKAVSAEKVAKKFGMDAHTIRRWQRIFQYQGIGGLENTHHNKNYSIEFKRQLVVEFEQSMDSLENFALKHGLKSDWQLSSWIIQYNESKLKAYTPRKRDSIMPGRKTTFEE
ncbi:MAG: transposase, partial [Limosilactobacillus pontis]